MNFERKKTVFTLADSCIVKLATFSWEDSNSRLNLRICCGHNYVKKKNSVISPQIEVKSCKNLSLTTENAAGSCNDNSSMITAFVKTCFKIFRKRGVKKKI